jgi:hypothetical protein
MNACMTAMRHVNPFLPLSLVLLIAAGCQRQQAEVSEQFLQHAAVEVQSEVLKQYAGVYRLPSGALLSVTFDGERLRAGTPPAELLAQTSRRFTSNRITAEIHFQRDDDGHVRKLDFQLAKRSHWCERVDPASAIDPTQMVDAGGVRLRMLVLGEGRPTIVLEDGFGSGIEIQSSLQAALAKVSRVVAYDHAGTGGSEAGVEPRDGRQIAGECSDFRFVLRKRQAHQRRQNPPPEATPDTEQDAPGDDAGNAKPYEAPHIGRELRSPQPEPHIGAPAGNHQQQELRNSCRAHAPGQRIAGRP